MKRTSTWRDRVLLGCTSFLIGAGAVSAAPTDTVAARDGSGFSGKIDALLTSFDKPRAPGCAVGVVRDGKVIHRSAFGMADIGAGRQITPATRFYIASVSKQFTALSIMLLAVDGKLSLDDELQKWVPEVPRYAEPVKIRHLLSHTSGLRDYLWLLRLAGVDTFENVDQAVAFKVIAHQEGVDFRPGENYQYSNTGFFLLARIVERASGLPFPRFLRERIFTPLGMSQTYSLESQNEFSVDERKALGYQTNDDGFSLNTVPTPYGGDGGIMTTVDDFLKYDQDFTSGSKVWNERVRALMLTPGVLHTADGKTTPIEYSAGLEVKKLRGQRAILHSGALGGYRAYYLRFPERAFSFVALCNRSDANLAPKVLSVAQATLGNVFAKEQPKPDDDEAGQPLSPELIDAFVGAYYSDALRATYAIEREGKGFRTTITSEFASQPRVYHTETPRLLATGRIEDYPLRLEYALDRDASGKVQALRIESSRGYGIQLKRVPVK